MKSTTINCTDPDGRAVVGVLLTNVTDKLAWLYREDFDRIAAAYPGTWSLVDARKSSSYVRARKGGRSVYIARVVANAREGTSIVFHDGNPLNLRTGNLGVTNGAGGRPKRKKFKSPLALFRNGSARTTARVRAPATA